MLTPQFEFEEFVDNTIFNTAMTQLVASMRESTANSTFFLAGVINPASLLFTFNSNLTVTVNAQNSEALPYTGFQCLFLSGAITDAHGIINGVDSSTYLVNFAPLVPVAGSITAYLVAQYAQVQENPITIIGAPPGHPDYSANFTPNIGYTTLQDTLNIIATTTVPDNESNIELARVTLTASQTVVSALDTTHQVLASLNAKTVSLNGDVTGISNSNVISNIQGKPVNAHTPGVNNVLTWNGSAWAPAAPATTLPPSGPAGGDLTGNYPDPQVQQSSTPIFSAVNIGVVGALTTGGPIAAGSTVTAGGNLIGAPATATNQAVTLGQLSAAFNPIALGSIVTAGDIYHNYFTIPIFNTNTSSFVSIYVEWGFYSIYGTSTFLPSFFDAPITYATTLPNGPLFSTATLATNQLAGTGAFAGASCTMEVNVLTSSGAHFGIDRASPGGGAEVLVAGPSKNGLLGFWWMVIGW